jgi:succinate dehydrogenase flavin-adding protein (antitoxin of CptAB toxin-antitoxin module)
VGFPDRPVFEFHYRVVQLNRLDWHEFVQQANPVASALVARMKIEPEDRPTAKLATLELLVSLPLTEEQRRLISSFIDTYLELDEQEKQVFQQLLAEIRPEQKEEVMELTTSWKREGIQIGRQEGIQIGETRATLNMVTRLLRKRFGAAFVSHEKQLEGLTQAQLEDLGEALLDFKDTGDLAQWLAQHGG